ncbi:MAG: hypothetical protein OEN00_08095, partial [Gemmatimonadota bacterium]|nr:hypothetical protein [Gemmatimonadota bacterium]
RTPKPVLAVLSATLTACAGGGAGVPSLVYAVPSPSDLTYAVADTVTIALQGIGQGMELSARSAATYSVHYDRSPSGMRVTATIDALAASVVMPMASPMTMDEGGLAGDFVFDLDVRGRVGSMSSPQATQLGAQVFAAPVVAHTLFPRLPGRVARAGDSWVDSVTYLEDGEAGVTQVQSALTYTLTGESQVDGRTLLEITFAGTAEVRQDLSLEGARINQNSQVEVEGRFHWDARAGVLVDSEMSMSGPGSVRVALLPGAELPTRVRWLTRVRLLER